MGRCLRHRGDYGAILLIDNRFHQPGNQQHLSRWYIRRNPSKYPKLYTLTLEAHPVVQREGDYTLECIAQLWCRLGDEAEVIGKVRVGMQGLGLRLKPWIVYSEQQHPRKSTGVAKGCAIFYEPSSCQGVRVDPTLPGCVHAMFSARLGENCVRMLRTADRPPVLQLDSRF